MQLKLFNTQDPLLSDQQDALVREPRPICLWQDLFGIFFHQCFDPFFLGFAGRLEICLEQGEEIWGRHAYERVTAEIDKELWASLIGLNFLYSEDPSEASLVYDSNKIWDVGVFGHLQHHILAELECVGEDGCQLWLHDSV